MPGVGDQHNASHPAVNPFEEIKPHVNEYTAQEIATLSSRLEKQLGPEYISTRPGASGTRVPYLAADKCINLANEVFGFNGWSSGIQQIQIDFVEESQNTGKVSLGLSVIVRVTLRDGTYHEDIGYGHIENCKGKAAAFEKAKKEGTTDALKRALRNFGNILGNCVYDKDYISKVTKIKVAPSRWDPDNLHRHPDYAPVKKEGVDQIKRERVPDHDMVDTRILTTHSPRELDDEFATDDFDEVDFSINHETNHEHSLSEHPSLLNRGDSTINRPASSKPRTTNDLSCPFKHEPSKRTDAPVALQPGPQLDVSAQLQRQALASLPNIPHIVTVGNQTKPQATPPMELGQNQDDQLREIPPAASSCTISSDPPIGFFTARVAETVQNSTGVPPKIASFNPHLESPSIRKTAGVDHSKTKPVGRDIIGGPTSPAFAMSLTSAGRPNFVNPQADKTRRVGMPSGGASPLSNRGSYKPPQIKRGPDGYPLQQPRPALEDVTSATVNVPSVDDGGDTKRQRTTGANHVSGQNQARLTT